MAGKHRKLWADPLVAERMIDHIRDFSRPLRDPGDLTPLLDRIDDARFVLLGEASHGTAEFYNWRSRISQMLIEEKDFAFIAVEGDWPDCYLVNRYIQGQMPEHASARKVLQQFRRWPTWMWANEEMIELIEWLKTYNDERPREEKTGFYGLDVYSLRESLHSLKHQLQTHHSTFLPVVNDVFHCFQRYGADAHDYARAAFFEDATCEESIRKLAKSLKGRAFDLITEQNVSVIENAEAYYRTMVYGGPDAWNIRDTHMMDTLDRLMEHHATRARGIVWAHNTHVGDARYTDMIHSGEVNLGQLVRERHGEDKAVLVGFATHEGEVIAGRHWEAPMQSMTVPEARAGSWDNILHRVGDKDKLLIFADAKDQDELLETRGQRAIGVVYHPEAEESSNYIPTVLPRRYDALLYIDRSHAVQPMRLKPRRERDLADTVPIHAVSEKKRAR